MSTFCHGVASAQAIDKSGEIVDIKGLDISSLAKTGVLNYEHKSDIPGQICAKILTAKKIFTKEDCSNKHEKYFWNKTKVPFVYITAELLDDYCQSGKDAAGILRYDHDKKDQNSSPILGFSVEGSEIPNSRGSNRMIVARGIARKVTLTASPCNSLCVAELLEDKQESQIKDDFESIFKSEANAIEMFKSGAGEKIYETFLAKKEAEGPSVGGKPPKSPSAEYQGQGIRIGRTKGGEPAYSHGHTAPYNFNPQEHQEGGEFHEHASVTAQNPKLADGRQARMNANSIAVKAGGRKDNRAALSLNDKDKIAQEQGKQQVAKSEKLCKHKKLKKDSNVASSPANPDPANAAAMQAGAMSGATSFGDAMSNIKSGLGFGKSESIGWSKGKVSGNNVHYNHPEYGTVTIQKTPKGFDVKHNGTLAGVGGVKGSFNGPKEAGAHAKKYMQAVSQKKIFAPKMQNISSDALLGKSIDAGSYNAAPSTLTNGAAYQTESISSKPANMGAEDHNFQGTKKKDWKKRAKDDYDRWPHKEKFEKFMQARMPHLALGEIQAIGRVISLKKSLDFEKSLSNLVLPTKK